MDKLNMHTPDLLEENFKKLQELFPNAVTETIDANGKPRRAIDADVLRQAIDAAVVEGKDERYQFTWPDKARSVLRACAPISKTLRLDRAKSAGRDGTAGSIDTENIYIEGDNLEALKILQETYLGKVKMIYIDPPYNTGNDFIYRDDFSEDEDEFLEDSGLLDGEGGRLVQNMESSGRFHTNWLNMIYPRLWLARDLLKPDGVIFISIDDNEAHNLRKCCDDIFGAGNFVCTFVRKNKAGSGHDSSRIAIEFDYVLCYARNIACAALHQEPVNVADDEKYKHADEHVDRRGKYYLRDLDYRGSYSEGLDYPIETPDKTIIYAGGEFGRPNTWRWSRQKFEWGKKNGFIAFQRRDDKWKVYIKQYQFVDNNDKPYERAIPYRALIDFSNGLGSMECSELLGSNVFSYPKPSALVKQFLKIATQPDSLVLDFFSGSGTTAHAVMQLNAEDGGTRRFIMIQLPEVCPAGSEAKKAGYANICEIGQERIRRAGRKIREEHAGKEGADVLDVGFRVFRVDSSNIKDVCCTPEETAQERLESLVDNIKEDRTAEDLLFQAMLELGIELSADIAEEEIAGHRVFFVRSGALAACFDANIREETLTEIAKRKSAFAVFRDSGLGDDSAFANFEQIFKAYSPGTMRRVI